MASREKDLKFDLESGGNTSEENEDLESNLIPRETKNLWSRLTEAAPVKDERIPAVNGNFAKSMDDIVADENIELLIDKNSGEESREVVTLVEKNSAREKKKNKKVALKPPRPPKGPALDAADRILVKEIAVLAMKKRARVERLKALKKAKAEKSTSLSSCIPAMFITFLFFLVMIIQGLSSRSSSAILGSPEPSVAGNSGFISVQYIKSFPPKESKSPSPSSDNSAT